MAAQRGCKYNTNGLRKDYEKMLNPAQRSVGN